MAAVHLTSETWEKLKKYEPFEGRDELVAHLSESCEVCEEVILGLGPGEPLDGVVDSLLGEGRLGPEVLKGVKGRGAEPPASWRSRNQGNDIEFNRIWRAHQGLSPREISRNRVIAYVAAAAAVIVLAGVGVLVRPGTSSRAGDWTRVQGLKGNGAVGGVELSFAIAWHDVGGAAHMEKGLPGREYPSNRDVLIRYRLDEPGYVAVIRVGVDGRTTEVVSDPAPAEAGEHDLEVDGRPAGYPLRKVTGRQRFVVVWSRRPMDSHTFEALAQASSGVEGEGPDTAFASFEILVAGR